MVVGLEKMKKMKLGTKWNKAKNILSIFYVFKGFLPKDSNGDE